MYSLLLDENGRILSIMDERYASDECPLIEDYPQEVKDGCPYDYRYVEGEFIYDPVPVDPVPDKDSAIWDELDAAYQEGVDSV